MKAWQRRLWASALLLPAGVAWSKCTSVPTVPATFGTISSTLVRSTVQTAFSSNSGLQ